MRQAPGNRRRRAALAGHTSDVETARELLSDPDPEVRSTALGALARVGAVTVPELLDAVRDPAPRVRQRAAEEVAARDPGTGVAIVGLLRDPEPSVVEVAAWASGERRPTEPGAVAELRRIAADHEDALCREAAVAALGAIGDPAALPTILAGLSDKATVRRRAVIALAPFDGPEVEAALEQARQDRDWQVRQAAEDLLTPP